MLNRFPCFCDGWRLQSTCGRLLIALSLIIGWRLSTLLKCSVHAHLSKIAALSSRSVLPYALSSGMAPDLLRPLTVFSALWNFFMFFLTAKSNKYAMTRNWAIRIQIPP